MPWMLMSYISPRWPHKNENNASKMAYASTAANLDTLAQPALPSPLIQRNATLRERSRRWSMKTSQSLKKLRIMMTKKSLEGFSSPLGSLEGRPHLTQGPPSSSTHAVTLQSSTPSMQIPIQLIIPSHTMKAVNTHALPWWMESHRRLPWWKS